MPQTIYKNKLKKKREIFLSDSNLVYASNAWDI